MGFHRLYMVCPGAFADGLGCSKKEFKHWVCKRHSNEIKLDENGTMKCNNNKEICEAPMVNWSFACHLHPGKYVKFNKAFEYRAALQDMCLTIRTSDVDWVTKLLDVIKRQMGAGKKDVLEIHDNNRDIANLQ